MIALDSINDPGNLGTIIRNADWFGVKNIICSKNTVELYNPKTIQSSMGSFTRVNVFYDDLSKILDVTGLPLPYFEREIFKAIEVSDLNNLSAEKVFERLVNSLN